MEKLIGNGAGTGVSGDWVHNTQKMGKDEDFSHVSKTWLDKCLTYDEVRDDIDSKVAEREDVEVKLSECSAMLTDDNSLIIVSPDGQEFRPTTHALNQLGFRVGLYQTTLKNFSEEPFGVDGPAILKSIINTGLRLFKDKEKEDQPHRLRTYKDGTLRAVLTHQFSPIDNRWVFDILKELIPDGRYSHWRGDADSFLGNVLIPDSIRQEDDSDYGGMLSISNSEIGVRRLRSLPGLFRAICQNGCIHQATSGVSFSKVHRGTIDYEALRTGFVKNLNEQIPLAAEIIDNVMTLKMNDYSLGNSEKIVSRVYGQIAKEFKLNPKQTNESMVQFGRHESAERNLFGIVQGLTRASQTFSGEQQFAMDEIAGRLSSFDVDSWTNFRKQAQRIKDDELIKLFGLKQSA